MADLAHEHDALAGVELWHGGCVVGNLESRLPARSVSQMTDESLYSSSCYELDKAGIREIQGWYADAAMRAVQAGFDIVNVHGAECGAITQHFLMAQVQPAHRRVRRLDRQPGAVLGRDHRARPRGGRRRDRASRPASASTPSTTARSGSARPRRPTGSSSSPTRSWTSGTCRPAAGWPPSGPATTSVASRFAGEFSHRDVHRGGPHGDQQAGRRRRPVHQPRHDGRGGSLRGRSTSSPPRGRRSPTRSCRRRSRRAATTRSASASAATSAPRAFRSRRRSSAPRTRPWARSSGAGGTPSASSRPRTPTATCSSSAPVRRAWSARWSSASAACAGSTSSTRTQRSAAACAPSAPIRTSASGARLINYRQIQLDKLRQRRARPRTRGSTAEDVLTYGAEIVVIATGSRWRDDGMNGPTQAPIPGAEAPNVYTPGAGVGRRRDRRRPRGRLRHRRLLHRPSRWPSCCWRRASR